MKKIFFNGDILTMDEDNLFSTAILIQNGIIKKVGLEEDILKLKDEKTELIDLKGHTLMPSFIDSHSHISSFANTLRFADLNNIDNFYDLINSLKEFKSKHNLSNDEWIVGFGYDNNLFKDSLHPTKEILDKVSLSNPIIIAHKSGHMGSCNSAALKTLEITENSADPKGGIIGRIKDTNIPNGYLEEKAFMSCASKIPEASLETKKNLLIKAMKIYASYGITTVQDGFTTSKEFDLFKEISNSKDFSLDVTSYIDIKDNKETFDYNIFYFHKYINGLKIGGFKLFLDGSPQGKTAWMTKPYLNSTDDYVGYPIYDDETVKSLIKYSLDKKAQLLTHCNGDAACDQLLNCFEEVIDNSKNKETYRPVMVHAQLVRYDQIDKMKKLNMIPSYFIAHTYFWGDTHIENFGVKRAFRISPARTTLRKDVPFTFHQDTPVILPDMLKTIWCAVNRVTKSGVVIDDSEKILPLQALKAITLNAAFQYSEENTKGSLAEGKLADLVILDKNPIKVQFDDIKDIKVLETFKEGVSIYKA